tara:strand:- start:2511 stop:3125 length:615 start_codon:yes stop_codon:yes gene_type:complete
MKFLKHHEYVSIGSQKAKFRLILLHGWGADADDLLSLGNQITRGLNLDFEIVSLRAPNKRIDDQGRAWYSLFPANWSEANIEVEKLITTLKAFGEKDIPLEKTVLLGFSQGAAMSLDAGTKLNMGLIILCSGYPHPNFRPEKFPPILISHGTKDDVVPIEASKRIYETIKKKSNSDCEIIEFDGHHEIKANFASKIRQKIIEIF